jgi:uncharacterized protein YegL
VTVEKVAEHVGAEQGAMVMPFYLVCDVSQSMTPYMAALNEALEGLRRAIVTDPAVDDTARICVMVFSEIAQVIVPLSQMSETPAPTLTPQGGTNYGVAFHQLARRIDYDTESLKQQGLKVYRPCVFFLTDGEPMDGDWEQSFRATLTYNQSTGQGMKGHPIFVPLGFNEARRAIVAKLAYPLERGKWYMAEHTSPAEALHALFDVITKTVITSGLTALTKPAITPVQPSTGGVIQGDYDPDYV